MIPKTTTKRTLRLLGVVVAVALMASVAVSGSALADTQVNYQDGDIDQAQKSSQANFAKVNHGDQVNKNKQVQAASIYQNNDQDQKAKKRHKKKDRHKKDKKKDRKKDKKKVWKQVSHQDANIDQVQKNAQANFAKVNHGDQVNKNKQVQAAGVYQNNDQDQKVKKHKKDKKHR